MNNTMTFLRIGTTEEDVLTLIKKIQEVGFLLSQGDDLSIPDGAVVLLGYKDTAVAAGILEEHLGAQGMKFKPESIHILVDRLNIQDIDNGYKYTDRAYHFSEKISKVIMEKIQ